MYKNFVDIVFSTILVHKRSCTFFISDTTRLNQCYFCSALKYCQFNSSCFISFFVRVLLDKFIKHLALVTQVCFTLDSESGGYTKFIFVFSFLSVFTFLQLHFDVLLLLFSKFCFAFVLVLM